METTVLKAEGIVCRGCAGSARAAVGRLPGVSRVEVDVPTKTVTVLHAPDVGRDEIVNGLTEAGFPAGRPM